MIVKPERKFPLSDPDGPLYVLPSRLGDGLFVQCEAVNPRSAEGRKVTLWIPPDIADDMLRELRTYAINRRQLAAADRATSSTTTSASPR